MSQDVPSTLGRWRWALRCTIESGGCPPLPLSLLRRAKVQRISEILQLPIIIEGRRPLALELQPLEEGDVLLRCTAAEGCILEEGFQPRLLIARVFGVPFHKRKLLQVLRDSA